MELNMFKDKVFELLNETDSLPIADIVVRDRENEMEIWLKDNSAFVMRCNSFHPV